MKETSMRGVCFFGGYAEEYPRNAIIRRGLRAHGVAVSSCRTGHKRKIFSRYARLIMRYARMPKDFSVIFVPEFRHKDVPLAWLLALLSRKRVVFDPLVSRHETKIIDRGDAGRRSFQSWYNRRIDTLSLKLPHLVFADTASHASYYRSEFGARNVAVLPVGYDDTVFTPRPTADAGNGDSRTVFFFGSYVPLHGVETIIDAAARLRDRPEVVFKMIGGGQTFDSARSRAAEAGLDRIEFLKRVPYGELPRHVGAAHICLGIFGTSEKASRVVPNKVYQCMAMRKPVITADSPAIREYFTAGEHLFTVPPGDGEALARTIIRLIDNPAEAESVAERGYSLVRERFSSGSIGRRFIELCSREGR